MFIAYASCVASAAAQASKPWRDSCGADSRLHGEHFSERAHGATRLSSAAAGLPSSSPLSGSGS
jgi:hypothetical protein